MILRAGIFFVALVVLMAVTFRDAAVYLLKFEPWAVYIPTILVAAGLMAHARVWSRLPPNPAWYVALAVFAVALIVPPRMREIVPAAHVLLTLTIVLVLLRLQPRAGSLYEGTSVPGVLVFLAFTTLLYQTFPIVETLHVFGVGHYNIDGLPRPLANAAAAAIVVAIFIATSGIRHRFLQPNPSRAWLWVGLVMWIAGWGIYHVREYASYTKYAVNLAHVVLFIGAFYLLSHLLPRRRDDAA